MYKYIYLFSNVTVIGLIDSWEKRQTFPLFNFINSQNTVVIIFTTTIWVSINIYILPMKNLSFRKVQWLTQWHILESNSAKTQKQVFVSPNPGTF